MRDLKYEKTKKNDLPRENIMQVAPLLCGAPDPTHSTHTLAPATIHLRITPSYLSTFAKRVMLSEQLLWCIWLRIPPAVQVAILLMVSTTGTAC